MNPDDAIISDAHYEEIRKHVARCLMQSGALGVLPTPVDQVLQVAKIEIYEGDSLTDGFLQGLRRKFGSALKSAMSKVWGVLDSVARIVHMDKAIITVKKTFLKLHETGHVLLPWQHGIYRGIEDCEKTLDPEVSELFDKEANIFASEVLFQLDAFEREAADCKFGINVPLRLAKRYGSSAYAAIRRYVTKSHRSCAVLVLNPPELIPGDGFIATKRRVVCSHAFSATFGTLQWPQQVTPDSLLGALVPFPPRKMSKPAQLHLVDVNGVKHLCYAEGFSTGYQVFLLILALE